MKHYICCFILFYVLMGFCFADEANDNLAKSLIESMKQTNLGPQDGAELNTLTVYLQENPSEWKQIPDSVIPEIIQIASNLQDIEKAKGKDSVKNALNTKFGLKLTSIKMNSEVFLQDGIFRGLITEIDLSKQKKFLDGASMTVTDKGELIITPKEGAVLNYQALGDAEQFALQSDKPISIITNGDVLENVIFNGQIKISIDYGHSIEGDITYTTKNGAVLKAKNVFIYDDSLSLSVIVSPFKDSKKPQITFSIPVNDKDKSVQQFDVIPNNEFKINLKENSFDIHGASMVYNDKKNNIKNTISGFDCVVSSNNGLSLTSSSVSSVPSIITRESGGSMFYTEINSKSPSTFSLSFDNLKKSTTNYIDLSKDISISADSSVKTIAWFKEKSDAAQEPVIIQALPNSRAIFVLRTAEKLSPAIGGNRIAVYQDSLSQSYKINDNLIVDSDGVIKGSVKEKPSSSSLIISKTGQVYITIGDKSFSFKEDELASTSDAISDKFPQRLEDALATSNKQVSDPPVIVSAEEERLPNRAEFVAERLENKDTEGILYLEGNPQLTQSQKNELLYAYYNGRSLESCSSSLCARYISNLYATSNSIRGDAQDLFNNLGTSSLISRDNLKAGQVVLIPSKRNGEILNQEDYKHIATIIKDTTGKKYIVEAYKSSTTYMINNGEKVLSKKGNPILINNVFVRPLEERIKPGQYPAVVPNNDKLPQSLR